MIWHDFFSSKATLLKKQIQLQFYCPPVGKSNNYKTIILSVKGHLCKLSTISTAFSYFYTTEGCLKQTGSNFTFRREHVTLWKTKNEEHAEYYCS